MQRADIVGETARYPASELDVYINDSRKELFSLLVRYGLVRPEATESITADGSSTYSVGAAWFATLAVFHDAYPGKDPVRLDRHTFLDRPMGGASSAVGDARSYRIAEVSGSKVIELYPRPVSGSYLHSYIPAPTLLVADDDELGGVLDYDEYIVIDVAIKCLRKEQSSTSALQGDKDRIMERIVDEAEAQDMGESHTVTDVRGSHDIDAQRLYNSRYWPL